MAENPAEPQCDTGFIRTDQDEAKTMTNRKKIWLAAVIAFSFGLGLTSASSANDPMCERACRSLQSQCWAQGGSMQDCLEVYALCQEGCFDP